MFIASAQRRYGDNPSRVVIRQRRIDRVRVRHAVPLLCTLVRDIPNGNSLILGRGRRREKNARKFFGFCTRESASVSEAHCFALPRNRSVRFSFKPPRAPRVRSGFAQRLIHHRRISESGFLAKVVCQFT